MELQISPDDFIDKVKNTAELQQAIGKLFETEKYFDYSGAFGELQDIFYFEFDKNYGDLELQRKIKINYLLIQPYLQMLDSSYTSEFFSKLNTHSEFESALKKIVLHDRKKITDFISNQKLTNCYSILLSTTHKLQRFSNDSNAKVSKYIAEQKESNAADKLPKEGEKSARKPEKGKLIRRLVTELYDLEKKLTDMRVTKSVNPLNSAFEIFEEHGAPIQEPMNWHEEIEGIVSSITELDFKSAKIAKLLDSFKKLNAILNNIGVEGHELFVERLKEIRSNFNIALVIEADETEVNLCLRAGTLSEPVRQKFDKFYGKIVREILKDEILVADCLADATLTEKRIENEQKRLSKLQTKSTRKDLVEKIAGGENLFFVEINSIYYGIEDIDLWGNPKDIDVLKAKYQALIPYIEREIITVESIAVINSKKDFRDVLEKIQNRIQVNRNNLIKTHPSREAPLDHLSSAVSILLQQVNEGNLESELNPELKERLIDLLNSNAMLSTVFTNKLSLPKVNWSSFVSIDEARNSLSMFEDILTSKDEYSPTSEIDHIYYGIRFLDVNNEKQVRILKEKYNRLLPYINKENITVELVSSTFDRASLASHLDKIQRRIITKYHELSKDNPQKAKSLSTLYEEISALHTELDDDQNFVDLRKIKLIELVEKYSVLVPEIFSSEIVIPNNQLDSKQEIISFKMKLIQIGKLFSKGRVGVFEKLQSLEEGLETNANLFEDKFARQLLLECYRDVVPQLILITKQQSLYYDIYLKKLESIGSKDDFLNAFNTLISHKAALNEQILIASKTDEISIALTHSRIRGFEERLIDEQKQLKEIKFQKCLKLDVVSVFNEYLGFYSPVFHQHIIPIFTEQKDKILGRITSADYIEEKLMEQIAMEIDENRPPMQKYKSLTPILEDNALQHLREVYKKLHFCNEFAVKVKLPKQKALLTKELREKNPVAQQKLDFMNAHEQNLISEIENKSIEEIREYMHTFHRKLKAYDDLMVVFSLIDKLDNGIRKQVAPLLPPVYVNPAYYEELLTLRARLDAPDYQYAKEDADIFENYYKAMQPILEKRNSRYTIDYFQIDNLEGLKKGVAELTPDLSPESKEFLTQIDTVTTIKGIITRKETGIAERKIATQYFFSQYVEPAFSLASVAAWIKDLIMEIKNFFAGNESYFNVKEINYFFKDRIRDIKPKLDPQDEEGEHIAQRNN
ncbi:protein SidH [Legionella hackeliae]|uniref:hypothetical protein n=1 Tax=Legionella hackeliae TaxID=449 RepID=UPI000E1A0936|nr:hypothetical protein [Legionella hackeliae]STX47749.1 protein SidH [Legionella hackeliae]